MLSYKKAINPYNKTLYLSYKTFLLYDKNYNNIIKPYSKTIYSVYMSYKRVFYGFY